MNETQLLSTVLQDRSAFQVLDKFIRSGDLSDRGQVVYNEVVRWYDTDAQAQSCDREVILERIVSEHPKHEAVFRAVLGDTRPVSTKNLVQAFLEFKSKAVGSKLIQALASNDKSKADELAREYRDLVNGQTTALGKDRKVFRGTKSDVLVESVRPENLLRLHPASLNDALGGGAPKGAHILIFAPPEVGKSLLSINIACGFLHDGRTVLYVGNEDPAVLMMLRVKSRLSGLTRTEILSNPDHADAIAEKHGFNNLVFASLSPGSMRDLEELCDEYRPDVVVCDQLSNIEAPSSTKVESLEWLAKQMRNLCKERDILGISITQAADSAQGKLVLDMGDVYYSNVAIQAQVDVMIGIGMDRASEAAGVRTLSLCKNKLNGNHTPIQVQVIPELSKVRG
jgi:archaellum biogenesis ATPase FlaH